MRRRDFLGVTLTGAGALLLGVGCASPASRRMADVLARRGHFQPTAFLAITPDDRIEVGVGKSEMGQGIFTTHAMLVAEELGVPVERVAVHAASGPGFENFGLQITGGSTSTPEAWDPVRTGAAAARVMLVGAAAKTWGVPAGECRVEDGAVLHPQSSRRARFGELVATAATLDIPDEVAPKAPDAFEVIGKATPRVDLRPKVTGAPIFGLDVQIEGMVKALVIRPPTFGGRVKRFDAAEARAMPGVIDVFETELGVAVVAEKYWQARRAAPKVEIEWDPGRNARFDSSALMRDAVARSAQPGQVQREEGDVDDAYAASGARVIESVYTGPYMAHAPMEPLNATVHVERDRCRIWVGTQFQSGVRSNAARLLGLEPEQIELHTTYMGGGFGRRGVLDVPMMAVRVAQRVGRPVQVVWSREQDTRGGFYRPLMVARMKGAVRDGAATAIEGHALSQSLFNLESLLPMFMPGWLSNEAIARAAGHLEYSGTLPNVLATEGLGSMTYGVPNVRVTFTPIRAGVPVTFWRSVGHSVNAFAVEGFVDELAEAAGADPVAFRRGLLADDPRKRAVLDAAAELGRWGQPLEPGWGRGVAAHQSFGTWCAHVIEAGVFDGAIKVRRVATAFDCGRVINPDQVGAQIESSVVYGLSAAIWGRIDVVEGRVRQGNYDDYRIMRLNETPEMVYTLVDSAEDPTGAGEPAVPPVAPALAGALFAATGKRLRSLPLQDALREVG